MQRSHPNIVFILADDMGHWALRCAGNPEIHTPNLDRLAASGMRMENLFCASPVCSPARASILTGVIPSSHGIHDWIRTGNLDRSLFSEALQKAPELHEEQKAVEYLAGISAYTEVLHEHGYTCALSGKWHLGDTLQPQKGITGWYTVGRGGCGYFHPDIVENGSLHFEDHYVTDLITDKALEFLGDLAEAGHPFHLGVHYTAPHSPWDRNQHPAAFFDLYHDCPFDSVPDLPLHPNQIESAPHGTGERRHELLSGYYAAITAMDVGIGRILDELEDRGLRESTLVVFTSDNGMNLGQHGIWGKGNGTFPMNMFDTSVKVPGIVSQPGAIPIGRICHELASHYDLMPTLLDWVGLPMPADRPRPGCSMAALWRGEIPGMERPVFVGDEYGPVRMVRTTDWKYVHRYPYGPHELYHLSEDPEEEHNCVNDPAFAEQVRHLRGEMERWFTAYSDPAVDGTRAAVFGVGQLGLAGAWGDGSPAFMDSFRYADGRQRLQN